MVIDSLWPEYPEQHEAHECVYCQGIGNEGFKECMYISRDGKKKWDIVCPGCLEIIHQEEGEDYFITERPL